MASSLSPLDYTCTEAATDRNEEWGREREIERERERDQRRKARPKKSTPN